MYICVFVWVRERENVCVHTMVCMWERWICTPECAYESMCVHTSVRMRTCMCTSQCEHHSVHVRACICRPQWRSEGSFQGLVLFFYQAGPGVKARLSGSAYLLNHPTSLKHWLLLYHTISKRCLSQKLTASLSKTRQLTESISQEKMLTEWNPWETLVSDKTLFSLYSNLVSSFNYSQRFSIFTTVMYITKPIISFSSTDNPLLVVRPPGEFLILRILMLGLMWV